MKTVFKNVTNSVILLSVLAVLLGIVLVAYPDVSLIAFGISVAVYLMIHGIILIILDIKAWRLYIPFEGFLQGILCIMLGILLATNPASIAVYIGIAMGIWIIVSGCNGIKFAAALKGTSAPWVLMIIMCIVDIIIGCLAICAPILSSISLTIWLGIVLIVHSIINIINMISVKKNARDLEKLIFRK